MAIPSIKHLYDYIRYYSGVCLQILEIILYKQTVDDGMLFTPLR